MYSLVNIAAVVRDLSRHPRADQVATELLRAFALGPSELERLDRLDHDGLDYDGAAQARRRAEAIAADAMRPRALQVLAATRSFAADIGMDAYSASLDVLETAPLGDLDALRAFVRHDVLADCWTTAGDVAVARWPRALDVVSDGIVGVYVDDEQLAAPWRAWSDRAGIEAEATAWPELLRNVAAVRPTSPVPAAPTEWAARMHDACWAVHLTGRERAAAVAQLHALRAVVRAWAPEVPSLRAVSMTTAAVHATVVADVLEASTVTAMTQSLFRCSSAGMS